MALDKEGLRDLLEQIEGAFDSLPVSGKVRRKMKKLVLGPILEEMREIIDESRAPVLMMMGRSGHGKSSLINALAGKEVAKVNDFAPQQPESDPYLITFHEEHASWEVIDTRGIFESTKPDGAVEDDAVDVLKKDIKKYKPDIIFHVVSTPEVRAMAKDMELRKELVAYMDKGLGFEIPMILVMNKADTFGNPREWPPEEEASKAYALDEQMKYVIEDMLGADKQQINLNASYYGYELEASDYVGIIPVSSLEGNLWNIEALIDFIGLHLDDAALLDFYQALGQEKALKKISSRIINRFSSVAGGIGATPIPIADIAVLTPIQILLITIVGALSGRKLSKETAVEYMTAAGVNIGAGFGLRELARQGSKLIPFAGSAISAGIAGASTYTIGKSAEYYFFNDEIISPKKFKGVFDKFKRIKDKE